MTDEKEIEEKANEYEMDCIADVYRDDVCTIPYAYSAQKLEQAFIDGAKWMQEHAIEWHNLKVNPNDLPTEEDLTIRCVLINGNEVICKTDWYSPTEDEIGYGKTIIQFYCNDDWIDTNDVIAWCELQTYKE